MALDFAINILQSSELHYIMNFKTSLIRKTRSFIGLDRRQEVEGEGEDIYALDRNMDAKKH